MNFESNLAAVPDGHGLNQPERCGVRVKAQSEMAVREPHAAMGLVERRLGIVPGWRHALACATMQPLWLPFGARHAHDFDIEEHTRCGV